MEFLVGLLRTEAIVAVQFEAEVSKNRVFTRQAFWQTKAGKKVIRMMMPGIMVLTGMASVASMLMGLIIAIVFAIRFFIGIDPTLAYALAGLMTFAIVMWALRPNIGRIMRGEERLVGPRARRKARQQQEAESAA